MAIFKLEGAIQHYDWGGTDFIPNLLNLETLPGKTYAEYWLGAHPKGEAYLITEKGKSGLADYISRHPEEGMGGRVVQRFQGQFPYLLKILDVDKMLSIQAHPGLEQAKIGFELENQKGIPLDAPNRNYRDANHKPEMLVALTPFWLLHGFRDLDSTVALFRKHSELSPFVGPLIHDGIKAFYQMVMKCDQDEIDTWLTPLAEKLLPDFRSGKLRDKKNPDYWAAKAMEERTPAKGKYDRGVFSLYLLNLVALEPGQGIFQGAGLLHAYLCGTNVELMASSDNVFRGGLTSKHVDIDELLSTLKFGSVQPKILNGIDTDEFERVYHSPVEDFRLSRIELAVGDVFETGASGPEILLSLAGNATLNENGSIQKGESILITDGSKLRIRAEAPTLLFRAGTNLS